MAFHQEMEQFFSSYSDEQRKRVEESALYQEAVKRENAILAKKIASGFLEGNAPNKMAAKFFRWITGKD